MTEEVLLLWTIHAITYTKVGPECLKKAVVMILSIFPFLLDKWQHLHSTLDVKVLFSRYGKLLMIQTCTLEC